MLRGGGTGIGLKIYSAGGHGVIDVGVGPRGRLEGDRLESFLVESWAEHMRQHARVTVSDKALEDTARAFHHGPGEPKVTHWIADDRG